MAKLTMREFISQLTLRLEKFTHEELKQILLEHGMTLPPKERGGYLDRFVLPEKPKRKKKIEKTTQTDEQYLLQGIKAFGKRAENYEFTCGWGWDDEYGDERAWGDDSWVSEIDDLFGQIEELYESGDYAIAREAYESLLDIYRGGLEESRFSGYDYDDMIATDIDEVRLKYLRCIYLTEGSSSRPRALFEAISRLSFDALDVNIHGMINVSTEDLPELDQFGHQWIDYLEKQKGSRLTTNLLKEAVRLFQGTEGLEALSMEKGLQFPGSFVEWLGALKKEKNYEEMVQAATVGLERLPDHLSIRAKIADYLHDAATHLKRKDLIDESLKEALYASPSLERLLDLLDQGKDAEQRTELLNGTLVRFGAIKKRKMGSGRSSWDLDRSPDLQENDVPENLEMYCHLLKGDYSKVVSLMGLSKSLGWSSKDSLNALAVPFFLYARWDQARRLTDNMADLWKDATNIPFSFYDAYGDREEITGSKSPESRFRNYLQNVLEDFLIPEKELAEYFHIAEKAALKRIDAIVGNKHRKSYWKAAQLLLAVAEVYWSNGQEADGQKLIDRIREKYHRHSAFKSELRTKAKKSRLFSVQ